VHFVGIGGIGMSGIAEVLYNLGYKVQGSDQADNANVQRLKAKGIKVFVGHSADNLGDAEVLVVSTAIKRDNPELVAAREKLLPIVRRAEMLAEIMRFRNASPSAARTARPRPPRWWRRCWNRAGWTRR
jgi:UDP-N-acetylmuramate--alanine ligase